MRRAVFVLGFVALALPLVAWGALGWFARYAADDYCTASQVVTMGVLQAQSTLYVSWSGRFAATLLITLAEVVGPAAVRVLPILIVLVWLAVGTWSACWIGRAAGYRPGWLVSALVASAVLYATLQTTADLPQVLYWQTGLLTYVAPLVMLTFLVGWIARDVLRPGSSFAVTTGVCTFVAFVAGGTNETFAAAQVTLLLVAGLLAAAFAVGAVRRRLVGAMLMGLAGALLSLGIVAAAPGNAVRAQTTRILPMTEVLLRAVDFTRGWLRLTFARPHVIELVLLIGIAAVLGATCRPKSEPGFHMTRDPESLRRTSSLARGPRWPLAVLFVLATGLVLLACMVPVYYALNADPPGRALLVPQYLLICALAIAAWCTGDYVSQRVNFGAHSAGPHTSQLVDVGARAAVAFRWSAAIALVLLLAVGPVVTTTRVVQQFGADRAYAIAWDSLDAEVRADRAEGTRDVTVARLDPTGTVHNLDFFGSDRQDWLNECVARYYAVNSIASR